MKALLIFLVIIVLAVTVGYYDDWQENPEKKELEINFSPVQKTESPSPKSTAKSPGTKVLLSSVQTAADFLFDTEIKSGPEQGEIIEDNKIVFEWKASSKNGEKPVGYETKIEGLDKNWVPTKSTQRTVTFPSGSQEYTFLVRAKTKDAVEPFPASTTFKIETSPYFGKVSISNVQKASASKPSLITLNTKLAKSSSAKATEDEVIDITGWKIESGKSNFVIPQGVEYYYPVGDQAKEDIILNQGYKVYLSSAQNPLGQGNNFRPNKCFGWLANYYTFPVSISKSCPNPDKEDYENLNVCCRELINNTPACKRPDYSKKTVTALDSKCADYIIENFNYPSCFNEHYRDEDFLKNEWHIYMNRDIIATNKCDTIILRDQNSLVVDTYDYGKDACTWY